MPKFATQQQLFFSLLKQKPSPQKLEQLLVSAKAELDDYRETDDEIKIELNDTNRPDLWTAAGLTRQLRSYLGEFPHYDFFSTATKPQPTHRRSIVVDKQLANIRPFIVGFEARGPQLTDVLLKEIIYIQERLCWNYGRKRKSIAMGIYRASAIRYPIHYTAANPRTTKFTPLGMDRSLSLDAILTAHPQGVAFGHLIKDFPLYPYLTDDSDAVLSLPPIINSAHVGAVQVGDSELFIELTGDDLYLLHTACNLIACDFADLQYQILPLHVRYPYQTPTGDNYVSPFNFHTAQSVPIPIIKKILGIDLSHADIIDSLRKMGMHSAIKDDTVTVTPSPWRNDYMHAVDCVEDIMIGVGMERFTPQPITDYTIGRLLPIEALSRKAVTIMVGLGFQEMVHSYLVAAVDVIDKMYPPDQRARVAKSMVAIANPRTEAYNYVRSSIIPSLLAVEAVSAQAILPHHIFEIGKVAAIDVTDNYGTQTCTLLGMLSAENSTNFTSVNAQLSAILYYLNMSYTLQAYDDARFILGRAARIIVKSEPIGIIGEMHPQVLENWNIQVPCTACEFSLEKILHA